MKYAPLVVLFWYAIPLRAQDVAYTPVQFQQFFSACSIINPAANGSVGLFELQSGRQQHGGAWKHISTTFVSANTRFNQRQSGKFQVAGIAFIADNEGQYLKRSRVFLSYGWHTSLSKKVSLGAGASSGIFNYQVASSNAMVGGTAITVDASLGLYLYSTRYYFGVSGNQILNNSLTPLVETTQLIRHVNLMGGYTMDLNKSVSVTPQFLIRYAKGFPLDIDVAAVAVLNNIVTAGINYRHHKGVVPMVGFQEIKMGKGFARLMFSYAVPMGNIAETIQTYELTLGYQVKPKKKAKAKQKDLGYFFTK
jgi:type IX secretion system PorP/SprF family membrane protein